MDYIVSQGPFWVRYLLSYYVIMQNIYFEGPNISLCPPPFGLQHACFVWLPVISPFMILKAEIRIFLQHLLIRI